MPSCGSRVNWGSGDSLVFEAGSFDVGGRLLATLPTGVGAIGFDFFAFDDLDPHGVPSSFNFSLATGEVLHGQSFVQPTRAFFGLVSDVSIASIRIELTNGDGRPPIPAIDNFIFGNLGTPAPIGIPTPTTLAVFSSGLAGLAWVRRRQGRQQPFEYRLWKG